MFSFQGMHKTHRKSFNQKLGVRYSVLTRLFLLPAARCLLFSPRCLLPAD